MGDIYLYFLIFGVPLVITGLTFFAIRAGSKGKLNHAGVAMTALAVIGAILYLLR